MLTLYENIKKRREDLGLTKVELASRVGYERSMITKIEQGKVDLTQSKIAAFAKALQTTPSQLLGLDIPTETVEVDDRDACILQALSENPEKYQTINRLLNIWQNETELPEGAIPFTPRPTALVPLLGVVNCGTPLFAEQNIEEYIETPVDDILSGETFFWLRAKGNSMKNVGIHEGDLLYIRKQNDVDSGSIAVVAINGDDATLKRVVKKENAIILQPENPDYDTQIFVGDEMKVVSVMGRLMKVEKRF